MLSVLSFSLVKRNRGTDFFTVGSVGPTITICRDTLVSWGGCPSLDGRGTAGSRDGSP